MFQFIKQKLQKLYSTFSRQLGSLFGKSAITKETLKELEILLIGADTGVQTTRTIIEKLDAKLQDGSIANGNDLKDALKPILCDILHPSVKHATADTRIHIMVGINGSGKTTFAGKLAHAYSSTGKKVLMVAADTFRAAAPEQLTTWSEQAGADIVIGKPNQDPASVVFAGCQKFKDGSYDALIIDTAGRLHTKVNLMHELAKIKRIITKQLPEEPMETLLTLDAMLGQNSFEQAKLFKESTDVNGIVLTKMDGTGKGGIVFSINHHLQIPIKYIAYGEKKDQYKHFEAQDFVTELLES